MDLSREGFRIRSAKPESAGSLLRIHIAPSCARADSVPICARGRIVRLAPLPGGLYSIGVRIQLDPLEGALQRRRNPASGAPQASRPSRPLAPTPLRVLQRQTEAESSVRRWRWLFLLALPLFFFWGRPHSPEPPTNAEALARGSLPDVIRLGSPYDAAAPIEFVPKSIEERSSPALLPCANGNGHGPPGPLGSPTQPAPYVRKPVSPGHAYWLARRGLAPAKAYASWHAVRLGGLDTAPPGDEYRATSPQEAPAGSQAAPPQAYAPAPMFLSTAPKWANAPVALAINKNTHRLTVYLHGTPARTFLVGLGRDGSTPSGEYRISTKIRHPDWWRRGESIPAGDPRNPLGEFWLGLSRNGSPLPIGLHPTSEPATLGADASEGCIRLAPEDARTLFQLCPSGTLVQIRE